MKCLEELDSKNNIPRLIPIAKQPERRLLSVFMSLLEFSEALRHLFLQQCDCRISKTGTYESHMEVTYSGSRYLDVRPDGLITCKRGKTEWSALIEAKAEISKIRVEQVQDYLKLAEQLSIDAVITISNDFALHPSEPPYAISSNKLKGRTLYHFAWAEIRTFLELHRESEMLTAHEKHILRQCLDYFWSDGSGIRTYDAMPEGWPAFVEASSTALGFNSNIKGFAEIIFGWQQERRDLCSKLTHELGRAVSLRHHAGARANEDARQKRDRKSLSEDYVLEARYLLETEKVTIDVIADLRACRITTSFDVPLPDGKGIKALVTWLTKCLNNGQEAQLLFDWPGTKDDQSIGVQEFLNDPEVVTLGRKDAPRRIAVMMSKHSVRRFKSRKLFIEDVETLTHETLGFMKDAGWIG